MVLVSVHRRVGRERARARVLGLVAFAGRDFRPGKDRSPQNALAAPTRDVESGWGVRSAVEGEDGGLVRSNESIRLSELAPAQTPILSLVAMGLSVSQQAADGGQSVLQAAMVRKRGAREGKVLSALRSDAGLRRIAARRDEVPENRNAFSPRSV